MKNKTSGYRFQVKNASIALRFSLLVLFVTVTTRGALADRSQRLYKKAKEASLQFAKHASAGTVYKFRIDTLMMDPKRELINLQMTSTFAEIPFRNETVQKYYTDYKQLLGRKFKKSRLSISSMGKKISKLVPNYYRNDPGKIDSARRSVTKRAEPADCEKPIQKFGFSKRP